MTDPPKLAPERHTPDKREVVRCVDVIGEIARHRGHGIPEVAIVKILTKNIKTAAELMIFANEYASALGLSVARFVQIVRERR